MENKSTHLRYTKYLDKEWVKETDTVVDEKALTIFINDEEIATIVSSPWEIEYMTVGFLRTEGLIKTYQDIHSFRYEEQEGLCYFEIPSFNSSIKDALFMKRHMNSCCGRSRTSFYFKSDAILAKPVTSTLLIRSDTVFEATDALQKESRLFMETGGVHSAGLFDSTQMISYHIDIGRHNTLDRIFGESLIKGYTLEDKFIAFSGRLASEIILKVSKMSIPIIISRSAPSSLALEIADELNITVIGFSRNNRFSVYTHTERIEDLNESSLF